MRQCWRLPGVRRRGWVSALPRSRLDVIRRGLVLYRFQGRPSVAPYVPRESMASARLSPYNRQRKMLLRNHQGGTNRSLRVDRNRNTLVSVYTRTNAHARENTAMSEHTPGPWAHQNTSRSWSPMHVKKIGLEEFSPGICVVMAGPNQLADARLIAAAPDLLAACKVVSEHIGKECATCQQTLDNAIAKAKENTT